jgi:hypothetical protein
MYEIKIIEHLHELNIFRFCLNIFSLIKNFFNKTRIQHEATRNNVNFFFDGLHCVH